MFFFLVQEIVKFVATAALDYPYFTWDEAGLYQRCSYRININECHCRCPPQLRLTCCTPVCQCWRYWGQTNNSAQTRTSLLPFQFPDS